MRNEKRGVCMEGCVVTRLENAAFELGRNSQAWTARPANSPVTAGYKTSADDGAQGKERDAPTCPPLVDGV